MIQRTSTLLIAEPVAVAEKTDEDTDVDESAATTEPETTGDKVDSSTAENGVKDSETGKPDNSSESKMEEGDAVEKTDLTEDKNSEEKKEVCRPRSAVFAFLKPQAPD